MSYEVEVFEIDDPVGTDSKVLISYGKKEIIGVNYPYPENRPGINNQVNLKVPLKFSIVFDSSATPESVDNVNITLTINNKNYEFIDYTDLFTFNVNTVGFTNRPNDDWGYLLSATSLENASCSLKCTFTVKGLHRTETGEREAFEVKFSINGNELHNINTGEIQIYSEANQLEYNLNLQEPQETESGKYELLYGEPKSSIIANYTYKNNKPDNKNEVGVLVPLKGSLELKHDRFPKAAIKTGTLTAEIILTDGDNFTVRYTPIDDKWYTLTHENYIFNFNLDNLDHRVNATDINAIQFLHYTARISFEVEYEETPETKETKNFVILISDNPSTTDFTIFERISPLHITSEISSVEVEYSIEVDAPRGATGKATLINVTYGDVEEEGEINYKNNKPNNDNEVDVFLPICGFVRLGPGVFIDTNRCANFNKDVSSSLTLITKDGLKIEHKNTTSTEFNLQKDNSEVRFVFTDSWSEKTKASPFNSGGILSLYSKFSLPVLVSGVPKELTVHILSNGNSGTNYYHSYSGDTVYIPMIRILSEQYEEPGVLEYEFAVEEPKQVTGNYEIVYGKPKTLPARIDKSYVNNTPDKDNNIGVIVPLKGSLKFIHDKYPRASIIEVSKAVFTLTGADNYEIKYEPTKTDNKWYSITTGGYYFTFDLKDWKQKTNATTINSKTKLSFTAKITLKLKIDETAKKSEEKEFTILVSDDTELNNTIFNGRINTNFVKREVAIITKPSILKDIGNILKNINPVSKQKTLTVKNLPIKEVQKLKLANTEFFGATKQIQPVRITAQTYLVVGYTFELNNYNEYYKNNIITVNYGSGDGFFDYPSNKTQKIALNVTEDNRNKVAISFPLEAKVTFNQSCIVQYIQNTGVEQLIYADFRNKVRILKSVKTPITNYDTTENKFTITFPTEWGKKENAWFFKEKNIEATLSAEFQLSVKPTDGDTQIIKFQITSAASSERTSGSVTNSPNIRIPFITIKATNYREVLTLYTDKYAEDKKDDSRATKSNIKKDTFKGLTYGEKRLKFYVRGFYEYGKEGQNEISKNTTFTLRGHRTAIGDKNWKENVDTGFSSENDPPHDIFIHAIKNNPRAYNPFTFEFANNDPYKEEENQ